MKKENKHSIVINNNKELVALFAKCSANNVKIIKNDVFYYADGNQFGLRFVKMAASEVEFWDSNAVSGYREEEGYIDHDNLDEFIDIVKNSHDEKNLSELEIGDTFKLFGLEYAKIGKNCFATLDGNILDKHSINDTFTDYRVTPTNKRVKIVEI